MPFEVPFPANRKDWVSLHLHETDANARAILLAPKLGKRNQSMLMLAGSKLRARDVSSCPGAVRARRKSLVDSGRAKFQGRWLVLNDDVLCTSVSEAAELAMGLSRDGWRHWQFGDSTLEQAFYGFDNGNLVFYDWHSRRAPYVPREGVAFSVGSAAAIVEVPHCLVKGNQAEVWRYPVAKKAEWEIDAIEGSCEVVLECRQGKVLLVRESLEISVGEAVLLRKGDRHLFRGIENSVCTVTRVNPVNDQSCGR